MTMPRFNTSEKDIEQFSEERKMFSNYQANFKIGNIAAGVGAINQLESMYQILLSSLYIVKDATKHKEYRENIAKCRKNIVDYLRAKGDMERPVEDEDYTKLLTEFDELVYRFYEIKAEVGMS